MFQGAPLFRGRVADFHSQVLVTFRARFQEAFPKHVPHVGPQDIEIGIVGDEPSEQVETLLCALLALVLNRKKIIEYALTVLYIIRQIRRGRDDCYSRKFSTSAADIDSTQTGTSW